MGQGRQPDLDCSASSFLESSKFTLSIHLSSLKPLFIFWLIYIQQYIKQNIVVVKKGEYDHNWITSLWAYHWQTKQWTCRRYKEERNIECICKAPRRVFKLKTVYYVHLKRRESYTSLLSKYLVCRKNRGEMHIIRRNNFFYTLVFWHWGWTGMRWWIWNTNG